MKRLLSSSAVFCSVCVAAVFMLAGCVDTKDEPPAFEVVKIVPPTPVPHKGAEKPQPVPAPSSVPEKLKPVTPAPIPPPASDKFPKENTPAKKNIEAAELTKLLPPNGDTKRFLNDAAFLTKWNVLGPFAVNSEEFPADKAQECIHKEFMPDEKNLDGLQNAPSGSWWQVMQFKGASAPGEVDLTKLYKGEPQRAAAYAIAYLLSPEDLGELVLYAGGSDFIKIWLNGKLVHTYNREPRSAHWDQDVIEGVQLNKGYNLVIVKTLSLDARNWSFYFRLTDKDGLPVCAEP
ncbi:MAG: hypothetical protein A2X49_12350 [Lentisphaerae bacterium GWF2_52_8]|nr:MAG: hypothetical protein A2X49_12350 [Lentisphaerae bacterium GWF2_52_8]